MCLSRVPDSHFLLPSLTPTRAPSSRPPPHDLLNAQKQGGGVGGGMTQSKSVAALRTEAAAAQEVEVAHPAAIKPKPDKAKLKKSGFVQSASNALNSRFSDMFKAFQYVDLDRSGTLDKKEIARALDLWNIPIDHDKLDDLIAACDGDGDGQVDYKEFVDVLARDTVASAAMGKRDMQAQEAMGVADLDPEFLGHKKIKNARASINNMTFD